ncbi:nitrate reductase cytochrome c-type subunit, partial [Persephonella sp.]
MFKHSIAIFLGTVVLVGSVLYISSTVAGEKTISPEEIGIRKQSVFTENTNLPEAKYPDTPPGTGHRFSRSYPTAPPQIPHSIKDFLPITAKENQCLNCHMPDVA